MTHIIRRLDGRRAFFCGLCHVHAPRRPVYSLETTVVKLLPTRMSLLSRAPGSNNPLLTPHREAIRRGPVAEAS